MKKLSKIVAIVATTVMVLGSSLTAFAATSTATVSATASDLSAVSATLSDGTSVSVSSVSESVAADAQKAAVSLLGNDAGSGSLQVEKIFDLEADIQGPTDITIAVPGVTAGQKLGVLHQKHDGTWESVPVVGVSTGSVTATFTSLSPVAIITYTSPKTGEAFPVAGIVCLIAFAGVAVCAKRRFAL